MFRGREMAHPQRGEQLLRKLADEIAEFGAIEQQPNQEGRNMTMVMAPCAPPRAAKKGETRKARPAAAARQTAEADGADAAAPEPATPPPPSPRRSPGREAPAAQAAPAESLRPTKG